MFLKAIELDPKFAAPHAFLANTYAFDWDAQFDDVPNALNLAVESAQKAVAIDDEFALAHVQLGWAYMWKKQPDKAIASGQRAIALDPNYDFAHALLGEILNFAGRPEQGLEHLKKAIHLNPYHAFWYKYGLGHSYDLIGRRQEAIELMNKALAVNPDFVPARRHLAVIYSELNRMEEARAEITEIQRVSPGYTISAWRARARYSDPATIQRFVEGLRRAGLPE
jgi:adenylate cyclase